MASDRLDKLLDRDACYAAMLAHDSRFDGRFFCGVSSTGIYCRPVCRVKTPKRENCTFFPSAAAAEAAGFRPCLKCRPELAPGYAPSDSVARTARHAAGLMEEDCLADRSLTDLAAALGVSDRHLRRSFLAEYGVSPVQFLQTKRLLLAKGLLTDTNLAVTHVAMSAGFGSIRRFNDLFKSRYRLSPGRFRNGVEPPQTEGDAITLLLGYRPPYAWEEMISFLAARAIPGVESVSEESYRRTAVVKKGNEVHTGWLSVAHLPARNAVSVTVATALLPVLPQVLARVRHLFDLNCDPVTIDEHLENMEQVAPGIRIPGIRLPGCFDPFEMATRAILGQQVTVKAARTLATRLAERYGESVSSPFADLTRSFPLPETICSLAAPIGDRLGPLGIIGARSRSILALAKAMSLGAITLSPQGDPASELPKLLALPGFGPWTVNYIAMRALGWPDANLETDFGVKKALSVLPAQEARELARSWSPWRSYATVTLWAALSRGALGSPLSPPRASDPILTRPLPLKGREK